jgi:hypothetical protein
LPNTLAHLGVQGFLQGGIGRGPRSDDVKWIALGCVLPDAPWIWHRALRFALGKLGLLDPGAPLELLYDLRLYAVVQASLPWCLLLALGVAMLARRRAAVFGVLGLGAVLHLLLDALETKWGNGVHLLAPFAWRELNLGWFWPESWIALVLAALGAAWIAMTWRRAVAEPPGLDLGRGRWLLAGACAVVYLATPLLFLGAAQAGDSHSIGTLRARGYGEAGGRVGRAVELHRAFYRHRDGTPVVRTLVEEELEVPGLELRDGTRVSVRGSFTTPTRLEVESSHVHQPSRRDVATYVGLAAVAAQWLLAWRSGRRAGRGAAQPPQGNASSRPSGTTSR